MNVETQLAQIMAALTANHSEVCTRLDRIEVCLDIPNRVDAQFTSRSGGQVPQVPKEFRSIPVVICKEL